MAGRQKTSVIESEVQRQSAERKRLKASERSRDMFAQISDIGDIPAVVNPERRERCRLDLFGFLTTYFPNSTGLRPFSADHSRVIARLQSCILEGGRFIGAVYRGWAKTTIAENSTIWATVYGHSRFIPLVGADAEAASNNLDSIKLELYSNDLLFADFPEVCYPIRKLENRAQRALTQSHNGKLTHIGWTRDHVVLPTIEGSKASGAGIYCSGIMAVNRGMTHKLPDGTQLRPQFVFVDDPQTDESAATSHQVNKRLSKLNKTILKLAGHDRPLSVFIAATVIQRDDMADQLLDVKRNPSWQGERIKMVKSWSKAHDSHWLTKYAEIRNTYNRDVPGDQQRAHREATKYYEDNREVMDEGAEVSWDECYSPEHEISAIQHAYNMLIDDGPDVFASECQVEPLTDPEEMDALTADQVSQKINGYKRGAVPVDVQHLTAMVDVQKKLLIWTVVGWAENCAGYVIDYGTYPDQKRQYFTLRDARKSMQTAHRGHGLEAAITAGLTKLAGKLLGAEYRRDGGGIMKIGRCLIDASWGDSTDTVYSWCRQSEFPQVVIPSHGMGITASRKPLNEYQKKRGDIVGHNWRIPAATGRRPVRHVLYDANYWKSFTHKRFADPLGADGSLSLFKGSANTHRMFADQTCAEYRVRTTGYGRTVDEWKLPASKPDNHYLDCLVGCAVAASMLGIRTPGEAPPVVTKKRKRKRVSYL